MKNPWEEINLADYENHMKLSSILQLQTMNAMMKKQFTQYSVKTIMILGVAGGNGLEHINPQMVEAVFGVDINQSYLEECKKRHPQHQDILHLFCVDLTGDVSMLPRADLVVANLLVEYIGYDCFQKAIRQVNPHYVSCGIQMNTDTGFVSESPYIHAFDKLSSVHQPMDERLLTEAMHLIQYQMILRDEADLPNGKKLVRLDFERQI